MTKCPKCGSDQIESYQDPETYEMMELCKTCGHTWIDPDWLEYEASEDGQKELRRQEEERIAASPERYDESYSYYS